MNEKLLAALRLYANRDNWLTVYETVGYGTRQIPDGFKFDVFDIIDSENEPWKFAQQALGDA